ncbi:MAG: hypothetical protein LBF08_03010 [Dysgonamonadaceae bacterium]|jgi:uncharacterized membrane protein|nr:hypothetical protein [Dysgonamonadaceae bacterium]
MNEKINIYEKVGNFFIDFVKLIIGGILISILISDSRINSLLLCVTASITAVCLFFVAIIIYLINNKIKSKVMVILSVFFLVVAVIASIIGIVLIFSHKDLFM